MTSGVITPGSGIALDPNRRSRTYELVLLGAATVVTGTSLGLVEWAQEQRVTLDLAKYVVAFVVLYGAAHYAVRRFAPYADPVILPVVAMLNGLGLVLIHRLDLGNAHAENGRVTETQEANQQILWTLLGLAVLVAVLALLRSRPGVTHITLALGASLLPAGDVLSAEVTREAAHRVLQGLEELGIPADGAVTVSTLDTVLSDAADAAEKAVPGDPSDAVVWEELTARTREESTLNSTFLAFLVLRPQGILGKATDQFRISV